MRKNLTDQLKEERESDMQTTEEEHPWWGSVQCRGLRMRLCLA